MNTAAPVIALDHPAAFDAARVGRKAAALARARAAGLPVGSGVVLTTQWCREDRATALQVWRIISHDGALALVVRPSAVGRDRIRPADTGAIESAEVVNDAAALLVAIDAIRHSADRSEADIPVLIQPHLVSAWQGVLFGDDSRAGWRRRSLAIARPADADADADADAAEWIAELDAAGRVRDVVSGPHLDHPPVEVLARLARLAQRVDVAFDGPHDIEWAADEHGKVHLLRVRPVVRLRSTSGDGSRVSTFCPRRPAQPVLALVDDRRADEPAA